MRTHLLLVAALASACGQDFETNRGGCTGAAVEEPDAEPIGATGDSGTADLADAALGDADPFDPKGGRADAGNGDGAACGLVDVHPLDLPRVWYPAYGFEDELGGCTQPHSTMQSDGCAFTWELRQVGSSVTATAVGSPTCEGYLSVEPCTPDPSGLTACGPSFAYALDLYSVTFDLAPTGDGYQATNVKVDAQVQVTTGRRSDLCARQTTREEEAAILLPQIQELFEALSWPCGPEN